MINRQLVHYDTAGQRVIIQPGDLTNVGGDVYAITPAGAVTSVADVPNTIPIRDGDGGFEVGYLQIDTTPPVVETDAVGKIIWNDTDGTLEFGAKGGNVVIQIGQEEVIRVKNDSGVGYSGGEVVYISGSNGTNLLTSLANANAEATSSSTIGLVTEPIAANNHGFITTFGLVRNINTNHLTEGAVVWLATVSGQTTSTRPSAPNHGVVLGFCLRKHAVNGVIFVRVDNGWELDELHNVSITGVAAGDLLVRNAGNTLWENKAQSTLTIAESQVTNLTTDLAAKVAKAGDTMTGTLNIGPAASQLFLTGAGNLRFGIGFGAGSFSSANAVAEFKPSSSSRFTFLDNLVGAVHNPVLVLADLDVTGKGMALFADTTSSAFIFSDNGNFDITSDTKAHIEAGSFGLGTLRFRVSAAGIATATGGMQVSDLTTSQGIYSAASGRLTSNKRYQIYATGTTNGGAGTSVQLTAAALATAGDLRWIKLTVKAKGANVPPAKYARTIECFWGNAAGVLSQTGADVLGTAFTSGSLAGATIASAASGTNVVITCTDVTGVGATVTWEIFGEYC